MTGRSEGEAEARDEAQGRVEARIERAVELGRRSMRVFPVRVWRRFLRRNGFLLSAGLAYQGLFAVFGLLYIAFASTGLWLGGSDRAVQVAIAAANSYIPGLIGDHGLVSRDDVQAIVSSSTGVLSVTGAVAVGGVLWTTITAITFARRAVRDMFGLPYDDRNFVLLKVRDVLAGLAFGLALLLGSILGFAGVWALRQVFDLFGWSLSRPAFDLLTRAGFVVVMFVVATAALALLVRFLTGTRIAWRTILPGALLGGGAVTLLQLGAGLFLAHTPSNPLLATFAVVVALLLWCRLIAIVILVAASWIALSAEDRDQPLLATDPAGETRDSDGPGDSGDSGDPAGVGAGADDADADRRARLRTIALEARARLRLAEAEHAAAPPSRRRAAARRLRRARNECEDAVAEARGHGADLDDEHGSPGRTGSGRTTSA